MTDALAVNNFMPALTLDEAAERYNRLVEYTKNLMTEGKDFGVIPGTGKKPTLLKPGAEKLCSLFGLVPRFELIDKIVDFEKGLFYFQYRCSLSRNGKLVAEGIGSCNSKEKKYRYRYIYENKATEKEKEMAISVQTKTGKYGKYKVYKIENIEPFELVNTLDKMAQKRSLVAVTLIAVNASEFYTQDIEDMGFIEGLFTIEKPDPKPKPRQNPKPKVKPKPKAKSTAQEKNDIILEELGFDPESVTKTVEDAKPEDIMTIERACKITNREGTLYMDIDSDKLSKMTNGIANGLKKPDLTPEKKQEYLDKRQAIKILLQARADGSLQ